LDLYTKIKYGVNVYKNNTRDKNKPCL